MPPPYDATTTASELVDALASHIQGKVVLTTGVSPGGLGAIFVRAIARGQPGLLVLASRSSSKAEQIAQEIQTMEPGVKTKILELELDNMSAVRKAADTVISWPDVPAIDVLVNNAGIMAGPFKLSTDGIERQFATNHLGHFLFTNLIMEKLLASSSPRVVNVSSDGHRLGHIRWDDYNFQVGHFDKNAASSHADGVRMATHITDGRHMGNLRRQICYFPYLWRQNLEIVVSCPIAFIPA
jgi:NAD(P)-dependent dehydrogenase (short-subunit alcohol dehydrogenase family)